MKNVDLKFTMTFPALGKKSLVELIDQLRKGKIMREEVERAISRIFASLRNIDAGLK